ncbi:MAG: ATP-binding protein [Oscillospiraceae bacterium]|nr:ATP-binding protein [Oscillospiraceae bacterium]
MRNRLFNGFFLLGSEIFFWTLLNAVSMVCNYTFFPVIYTIRMVFVCIIPFGIIWFILQLIDSPLHCKWVRNLFFAVAIADIAAMATNPLHHSYFSDYNIPIPARGTIFWIHTAVDFLFIGIAFIIYVHYIIKKTKGNPLLILTGIWMMFPYALNFLYSSGKLPITFDVTPIGFFVAFVFFVFFAHRSQLFTQNYVLETVQRTMAAIFESNPHTNVMFDGNFKIIDCNPSAIEMMGFKNKDEFISGFTELIKCSIPELQADGKPSLSMLEVLTITATEGYYKDEIDLVIRGNKRIFDLEIKRIPYGDNFALLGYMTDLTDRREKEIALARRTSELEIAMGALEAAQHTVSAMFDSNPHMNVMFDSKLDVVDCNPAAVTYMGFETKEKMLSGLVAKMAQSIPAFQSSGRPSQSMAERLITTVKEGYSKFESELMINGELRILNAELKRIPYEGSFAIVAYMTDLTEIHKLQKALKVAVESAKAANRAKSVFLANMSHEIRTPMNSIMGFAELAREIAISPHVKKYLEKINDSTKWLLCIINDILDISKIESGKMELENVPFEMQGIFARCQSVIHPNVFEKGLELRVCAEPPIGKKLLGDPVKLYQALMNLLSNSVKFTSEGTVTLSSAIKHWDGDFVTIYFEVRDSGIGMSEEQIEKIFEPFTQADSSTTRNYGGTGLGLAITKNIVELMGGKLKVESEINIGSVFSFELTFETISELGDVPEYIENNAIEKPLFDALILICEDNPMNQQVICDHLAQVGIRSVIAENGKIGLEMVEEHIKNGLLPFDMIFMDIFMPVMDGIEAASKISALGTGTPIVAMTANVMIGELDNYKKSGMDGYVGKPFTAQELWRCLLKYLSPIGISSVDEFEHAKENEELQKKLKINFAKNNQNKCAEIAQAIKTGEITLAHRLAHNLKGNSAQIGKMDLHKAASDVEELLKCGNIAAGCEKMINLEKELAFALEELKPFENPISDSKSKNPDSEQTKALFAKLEQMLANINPECVDLLNDIRNIPGSEDLAFQIEDYDFDSAIKTLAKLKKDWM